MASHTPPALYALLADLARAYPRQAVTADTVDLYARELDDLPVDLLVDLGRRWIRTERFFPTVAELRGLAAEETLRLPTEEEAVVQVNLRIAWGREDHTYGVDPEEGIPAVHPVVAKAVKAVGGYSAIRVAEKPEVVLGQFLRLYRDLRSAAIRDAQVGDLTPLLPPGETP